MQTIPKPHSSVIRSPDVTHKDLTSQVLKPTSSVNVLPSVSKKLIVDSVDDKTCKNSLSVDLSCSQTSNKLTTNHLCPSATLKSSFKKPTRAQQSGVISVFQPRHIEIYFESLPWWLLSLDETWVDTLIFPQFHSEIAFETFIDLSIDKCALIKSCLKKFFKSSRKVFGIHDHTARSSSTALINGSPSFLAHIHSNFQVQEEWIFLSDSFYRQRLRDLPSSFHFCRLRHSQCGGPTTAEVLWSSSDPAVSIVINPITRVIGDFVKYSIRPSPATVQKGHNHLSHVKLLPVNRLNVDIHFPSTFSHTGFGSRPLTAPELACVFGLESSLHDACGLPTFGFPPVQIMDSLLFQFGTFRKWDIANQARCDDFLIQTPRPVPNNSPTYLPSLRRILPNSWIDCGLSSDKVAKADDAEVQYGMWDQRILSLWPHAKVLLRPLRSLMLRYVKRKLYLELLEHLRVTYPALYGDWHAFRCQLYATRFFPEKQLGGMLKPKNSKTFEAYKFARMFDDISHGTNILNSFSQSSFFGWESGSSLVFWRWHHHFRHIAKNGFPAQVSQPLPTNKRRSRTPSKLIHQKLWSKIEKGIRKSYLNIIHSSRVKNVIDYFGVPKAEDIRMVQNGSSCGLNEAVWASNFWLPMSGSMIRVLGYNYKVVDIDLGEMFLNFPLDPQLIPYSAMDISPFRNDFIQSFPNIPLLESSKLFVVNNRCWMGLRPSPEWACRFYYLAEEFIRGDESDRDNPLFWDQVKLNLIGNEGYNASLPNVMKWNSIVGRIAGDIKAYVDDLRAIGWSLEHAWQIARRIASRLQYLGIQDAARKRRVDNGPWAGCIYRSSETAIQRTVTLEKWNKAKKYINDLNKEIESSQEGETWFEFNYLEKIRGFLCHLAMTYEILFPFLKGFHLSLCAYLPKRNESGWKIRDLEWIGFLEKSKLEGKMSQLEVEALLNFKYDPNNRPKKIQVVPRFYSCLKALTSFFESESPPIVTDRTSQVQLLIYGFVDASKSGYGASVDYQDHVRYRIGVRGPDEDEVSSNFREFCNLVETLEEEHSEGRLSNATVIMATDNSTVESALFKGNSSSELLFDLVVRFKKLQLMSGSKFIVTHVSGLRMQHQGTDGISRGSLREGISLGKSMLSFCPWGHSALSRSPTLKAWLQELIGPDLEILSPSDWFTRGHDHLPGYIDNQGFYRNRVKAGKFLWDLPPAAADAALEELRKARLKRRNSTHIILIPKLATTLWLRQLYKSFLRNYKIVKPF